MSSAFMFAIALMYLGAAVCFAWEEKVAFSLLSLCWGAGNLILGYMSRA